ncbi:MAG: XrtA-associated tyrosine autokinase [Gammaproteobacteria bacterium]|jgi:exopolysaccharide/PEP-CTERM locus tyrosine autokinase|nr:XrtA-associated tyrosine autokinase [Gammaproteobacteria bacterium]
MDKISTIEKAMERVGDTVDPAVAVSAPVDHPATEAAAPTGETSVTRAIAGDAPASGTVATPASTVPSTARTVHLDLDRLEKMNYITHEGERTLLAEEYRLIKRPLLANAFGKNADLIEHGNLIMVTSARAGEGKTFTSVNLAMSIAMEMDRTVLLVDADVGRPRVHQILGTPLGPGLIDLLLDDSLDVADVMLKTNVPKLSLIPMGRYHDHSTELLASQEMLRLTGELAGRYPDRVVIFDAPPLLITSEAVVLAGLMGQIVFVVLAEKTPRAAVRDALSLLDANKPIGLVLNKCRRTPGDSYGYGYGYGASGKS